MASTPSSNFDFQNFYSGQLTADITNASLTISLDTVPTPSEGILIIEPDSTTNREVIYYTSKGASTITCPADGRGWDSTTATSHLTGSTVIMAPVAYMLRMFMNGLAIYAKSISVNHPQGFMQNGQINVSVASNNLTVAIKGLDGGDPSATSRVIIRIGNTVRTLSSALSLTLNAGTNWFSKGASYFGGNESDFFVYLVWNTNQTAVQLAISSDPNMRVYSDFSTTNTAWNYFAGSAGAAPASTDTVELIGRFNATLGVSATYNWSLPATQIIINRPVFETRVFSAANSGSGGGTVYWQQRGGEKRVWGHSGINASTTGGSAMAFNLPGGFLSTIYAVVSTANNPTATGSIDVEADSYSTSAVTLKVTSAVNQNCGVDMSISGS